jgi:hypothetical protein
LVWARTNEEPYLNLVLWLQVSNPHPVPVAIVAVSLNVHPDEYTVTKVDVELLVV